MLTFKLEDEVRKRAQNPSLIVVGVDESGVGSLAGPVIVVAVVLPERERWFRELNDSKLLTRKQREHVYKRVAADALAIGRGRVPAKLIDEVGIYQARYLAFLDASAEVEDKIGHSLVYLIDGLPWAKNQPEPISSKAVYVPKADQKSLSVAAASVIAKVERDEIMTTLSDQYPYYNFSQNKGYPTRKHLKALRQHGPSPIHRKSFKPVRHVII